MENIQEKVRKFVLESGIKCSLKFDEPMAQKTTFKIGGKALVFAEPQQPEACAELLKFLSENSIKYFITGGCSNIVFCDGVFEGVVISMLGLSGIKILETQDGSVEKKSESEVYNKNPEMVFCGAGTLMAQLVNFATENDLWGVQQFAGLPGSCGGAVYMNARCFDREISSVFVSAEYIDMEDFCIKHIDYSESDWSYKVSPFQNKNRIIVSEVFRLEQCSQTEHSVLVSENKKYINERKSKGHFEFPSAGSVFRNNRQFGAPSGKIIDDCGLKGLVSGNAQIAPFHGNFIINKGGATQKDVKDLVEHIIKTVSEKKGFILEPEIIFVNQN